MLALPETVRAVTLRDSTLRVDLLVSGLSLPTTIAFIGPNDLLVLQKNDGRVRRVTNGVRQPNQSSLRDPVRSSDSGSSSPACYE